MIKRIGCAIRHPSNRSFEDFQTYWATHHGPLFSHTPDLLRYVQHITLREAYGGTPAPTHDGVSMFWYAGMESVTEPPRSPKLADIVPQSHTDTYDWYVRTRRYGGSRHYRAACRAPAGTASRLRRASRLILPAPKAAT